MRSIKLIQEIRDGAVDSTADLSTVLRRARVLATILDNDELKSWVSHELTGYPTADQVPDYREILSPPLGNFSGPFGQLIRGFLLPISHMPDFLREKAVLIRFPNAIKELESMARAGNDDLRHPWPTEVVIALREKIKLTGGFVLVEAYQAITVPHLEGIIDAVRNRLLEFILALEQIDPSVLASEDALRQLPKDAVNQVFHVSILGSHNVLATGSGITQTIDHSVSRSDLDSLVARLKQFGLESTDLQALKVALYEDGQRPDRAFGDKVKTWIGKTVVKAIDGTWKVAVASAPEILTKALAAYYGWN